MRRILLCLFLILFSSAASASAEVEAFAKLPKATQLVLSPDGAHLALTVTIKGKRVLMVRAMQGERPVVGVMSLGEFHIHDYKWANNDRILVWLRDSDKIHGRVWTYTRIVAVDKDGSNPMAIKMNPNDRGFYLQYPKIISWIPEDSEHVLAMVDGEKDSWAAPRVHRVNVFTGKRKLVQANSRFMSDWIADNEGDVRVGIKQTRGRFRTDFTSYLKDENGDWETLQKIDYFDHDRLIPIRFDRSDNNILLVSNVTADEENDAGGELFRYDLKKRKIVGPYKNKRVESLLSQIRAGMPEMKVYLHNRSRNGRHYIFSIYSDTQPKRFFYINLDAPQLEQIGNEYPQLEELSHASIKEISYEARDGLSIPALLTLPNNYTEGEEEPVPLIVFPHGGPWAHDKWGFDNYVQFFAHRGYAVLQPQFRGSTGHGIEHVEAGFGEWGGGIQDDITDGVRHVLQHYNLDESRVCIVGASFGGYAAAMGLVKTPELYRCGASINGVMDLPKLIVDSKYSLYGNISRKVWNDRRTSDEYSPYHLADAIQAPILLIASKKDSIVPYQHSKNMFKRLKRKKRDVRYVELEEGEHWRTYEPNEIAIFKALDQFLREHLN